MRHWRAIIQAALIVRLIIVGEGLTRLAIVMIYYVENFVLGVVGDMVVTVFFVNVFCQCLCIVAMPLQRW